MHPFQSVRQILSKLTPEEKSAIRTYLGSFIEKGKTANSKSIQLFDILVSDKGQALTDKEVEEIIYRNPNSVTVNKLVVRLREKILEALILDVNMEREGAYEERNRAIAATRKLITQAQILQYRGLREIALYLFNKALSQCKKYEFYEELLTVLRLMIKQQSLDEGEAGIKALLREYNSFDDAKTALLRAEINHRKIISETDFHNQPKLKSERIRRMLDEMSEDYRRTRSAQIGNYYFHIEAQLYQQQRNYKNARKALLCSRRLLDTSQAINTAQNFVGTLMNLADNDLYLTEFERCYETAEQALERCKKAEFNYAQIIELMFYAKYYGGEYQIAANLIFQLTSSENKNAFGFRAGKRNYLLANSYFMMEDFHTAMRYLNLLNPIEADKDGWNIGIKVLLIMTLIELGTHDDATGKIEALRKYIEHSQLQNHRLKMICQVFLTLSYNGYNFKTAYQKERSCIEMLDEDAGALQWQIKSSELVIFHKWFFSKVTRQKFIQRIKSQQLNPKNVSARVLEE
jgi:hypothetical protein